VPTRCLHPTLGQLITAIRQQPQRDQLLVMTKLVQPPAAHRHHRHRVRVDRVALAGVAGVEHPHPRGQLRRHIDHALPTGQQPLGQWPARSVSALDRPPAVRPLLPHLGVLVDRLDRHRPLVRIHPDHHAAHLIDLLARAGTGEDGQSYFEPGSPLLSHASPRHPAGRMPEESHAHKGGQPLQMRERPAEHLDPSLARPEP
jgi:hypothetical protein